MLKILNLFAFSIATHQEEDRSIMHEKAISAGVHVFACMWGKIESSNLIKQYFSPIVLFSW